MTDGYTEDAAALAAAVLDEEAKRQAEQAEREAVLFFLMIFFPASGINRCPCAKPSPSEAKGWRYCYSCSTL